MTAFCVARLIAIVAMIMLLREAAAIGPLLCFNPEAGGGSHNVGNCKVLALWRLQIGAQCFIQLR